MRHVFFALLGTVAAASSVASAEMGDGNSKVSVGYTHYVGPAVDLGTATVRYDYSFLKYAGIEAEYGFGVIDDELSRDNRLLEVEVERSYGAFARLQWPLDRKGSNLFVRGGYQKYVFDTVTDTDVADPNNNPLTAESETDGFAYGVGAHWMATPHHGFRADYTRLDDGDDDPQDTYSLSYVFRF